MNTFGDFLAHSLSQKEVSLVVVGTDEGVKDAVKELESNDFSPFKKLNDLERSGKRYFIIDATNAKRAYDIAREYGTGQISSFNTATGTAEWITPVYRDSALVFVVTKEELIATESTGLDVRNATGLAFQFA